MQDGCKVCMDSYMASNGSCFMVTWIIFKNHLLEVCVNNKPWLFFPRTMVCCIIQGSLKDFQAYIKKYICSIHNNLSFKLVWPTTTIIIGLIVINMLTWFWDGPDDIIHIRYFSTRNLVDWTTLGE
jgi:hypothetical protein